MKGSKTTLLVLANGGMELSWIYAWAAFLMTSTTHRFIPLPEAIGTFGLAAVLTILSRGRGWRVIYIIGLHVLGFAVATSRILHVFYYSSYSFFSKQWLLDFFGKPRDPLEWFILVLLLFWAILFWIGGVALAKRPTTYLPICSRFDIGLTAFFSLLLIKFLILVRGDVDLQEQMSALLLLPFFLFSLLAIGLVRNQGHAQKHFLSGYQGIGVILSFAVVVLLFGAGIVLLFLPYLTAAAEMGYDALRAGAAPLGPVLVTVLRFLFAPHRLRSEPPPAPTRGVEVDMSSSAGGNWWADVIERIVGWGILGVLGLICLVVCGFAAWYLLRWLLSRTSTSKKKQVQWDLISLWAREFLVFLHFCWERIRTRMKDYKGAGDLYAALLIWGRRSGLPHFLTETPVEYGLRLKNQFPKVGREIDSIIETFNQAVYGEIVLDEQQIAQARSAWDRLCSPSHWPSRLRSWLLRSAY